MSEVDPATLALTDVPGRATAPLVVRDVHRKRASLGKHEPLVGGSFLSAEILGPVNVAAFPETLSCGSRLLFATTFFHSQRATTVKTGPG